MVYAISSHNKLDSLLVDRMSMLETYHTRNAKFKPCTQSLGMD